MNSKSGNKQILNVANGLTAIRMIGAVSLLFFDRDSLTFTVIYTLTGLTDVLDGWIARRTGTAGKFGSTLDSIADLLFYSVMLWVFLPVLYAALPTAIWYFVAAVLLVRAAAYATAAVRYRRFASLHTLLNKLTGFSLFLLPYALLLSWERVYSWIVVALAFVSSLEELIIHFRRKSYSADVKTIFYPDQKEEE